jgi:hypothetical protein
MEGVSKTMVVALYELLDLLTPESDQHDFTTALYALYEFMYLLTPESNHHGFTNVLYAQPWWLLSGVSKYRSS